MSRLIRQLSLVAVLLSVSVSAPVMAGEISDSQKEQLRSLAMETRRKSDAERKTIRGARMDLNAAYAEHKLDERKVKAALDRIQPAQRRLLDLHLDNQIRLREILTEQQFGRFAEMTRKMMGGRGFPGGEDGMWERWPDKEMLSAVGVSAEQMRQIRALMERHEGQFGKLRKDSAKMLELYSRYDLDTAAARKLIESIHQAQVNHSEQNRKRQLALRSILSQDQWQRLQKALDERGRELRRRHAPPEGRRPRR